MGQHDAAWLLKVEAHVREAKAGEALRRHGPDDERCSYICLRRTHMGRGM